MSTKTKVCQTQELTDGQATKFTVGEAEVAIVKIGDDIYAIADQCSHGKYSLSEGDVDIDDKTLECAKHGSCFSLTSGEPLNLPATQPVKTYEVSIVGDDVFVVTT